MMYLKALAGTYRKLLRDVGECRFSETSSKTPIQGDGVFKASH